MKEYLTNYKNDVFKKVQEIVGNPKQMLNEHLQIIQNNIALNKDNINNHGDEIESMQKNWVRSKISILQSNLYVLFSLRKILRML